MSECVTLAVTTAVNDVQASGEYRCGLGLYDESKFDVLDAVTHKGIRKSEVQTEHTRINNKTCATIGNVQSVHTSCNHAAMCLTQWIVTIAKLINIEVV